MGDMRQQIQQSSLSSVRVTESVSDILEKTLGTQRAADRMNSATNELRSLFDRLREDTGKFKLEDDTDDSASEDAAIYALRTEAEFGNEDKLAIVDDNVLLALEKKAS
jgi:hypothetical protein